MAGKKKKEITQKERLLQELDGLLPTLDEEGLIFLIRQAQVHIHNMQVDKLNKEMEELQEKQTDGNAGKKTAGPKGFTIEIEMAENGKTYYFIVNGRKHFLDIEETQNIVKLCYRPPAKSAALKFLYQFFVNERDEILSEHKIKDEKSPFFEVLFNEVRSRFTLS